MWIVLIYQNIIHVFYSESLFLSAICVQLKSLGLYQNLGSWPPVIVHISVDTCCFLSRNMPIYAICECLLIFRIQNYYQLFIVCIYPQLTHCIYTKGVKHVIRFPPVHITDTIQNPKRFHWMNNTQIRFLYSAIVVTAAADEISMVDHNWKKYIRFRASSQENLSKFEFCGWTFPTHECT